MSESKGIKGKEAFIARVSKCLGRRALPETLSPPDISHHPGRNYLKGVGMDEIKDVFVQNAEAAGTAIYECDPDTLAETLVRATSAYGKGPLVMEDDVFLREHGAARALGRHFDPFHIWDPRRSREENIAHAEKSRVGVVKARLALAESGSVLLFTGPGCGRSVSLLPRHTVTVIRKADILPRLTQAMSFLDGQINAGLPPAVYIVSGASSTADIELVRIQGVHGPVSVSCVIVG
jgi:L-lactate dehydrogenase complex protein LldG